MCQAIEMLLVKGKMCVRAKHANFFTCSVDRPRTVSRKTNASFVQLHAKSAMYQITDHSGTILVGARHVGML
jgi:hypothetical protein